jgi:hypothetical protein
VPHQVGGCEFFPQEIKVDWGTGKRYGKVIPVQGVEALIVARG